MSAGLTDHLDIGATLMDAAGARTIEDSLGRSLVPLVNAGAADPNAQRHKTAVLSEFAGLDPYSMVLTDRYKMTVDTRTREPLDMYDMAEDPREVAQPCRRHDARRCPQGPCEEYPPELLAAVISAKLP